MVKLALPLPVDPPQITPPQSGLIEAARKVGRLIERDTGDPEKWEVGGLAYLPIAAGPGSTVRSISDYTHVSDDADRAADEDRKQEGIVTGYPVILEREFTRSSFGFSEANYQDRAREALKALQSKLLEWEFWTGQTAKLDSLDPSIYQWLAQQRQNIGGIDVGAVDITPGAGAVDPKHALALLEQAVGESNAGFAFIHMTRQMGILTPDRWSEGPLITWPDSAAVVGSGYPGTGPTGAAPAAGESWMYGTDPVDVRLGPISVWPESLDQALDRSKNTISFRAQRMGLVTWDGYAHYAVRALI